MISFPKPPHVLLSHLENVDVKSVRKSVKDFFANHLMLPNSSLYSSGPITFDATEPAHSSLHKHRLTTYMANLPPAFTERELSDLSTNAHRFLRDWVDGLLRGGASSTLLNTIYYVKAFRIIPYGRPQFAQRTLYVDQTTFINFVKTPSDLLCLALLARNIDFCLSFIRRHETGLTMRQSIMSSLVADVSDIFIKDSPLYAEVFTWLDSCAAILLNNLQKSIFSILARSFGLAYTASMFPTKVDELRDVAALLGVPSYLVPTTSMSAAKAVIGDFSVLPVDKKVYDRLTSSAVRGATSSPIANWGNVTSTVSYNKAAELVMEASFWEVINRMLSADEGFGWITDTSWDSSDEEESDEEGDEDREYEDDLDDDGYGGDDYDGDDTDDENDDYSDGDDEGSGEGVGFSSRSFSKGGYDVLFKNNSSLSLLLDSMRARRDENRRAEAEDMRNMSGIADWVVSDSELDDKEETGERTKTVEIDALDAELKRHNAERVGSSWSNVVHIIDVVEQVDDPMQLDRRSSLNNTVSEEERAWFSTPKTTAEVYNRHRRVIQALGNDIIADSVMPTKMVGQTASPSTLTMRDIMKIALGHDITYFEDEYYLAQEGYTSYVDVSGSMSSYYIVIPELMRIIQPWAGRVFQFSSSMFEVDPQSTRIFTTSGTRIDLCLRNAVEEGRSRVILLSDLEDDIDPDLVANMMRFNQDFIVIVPFTTPSMRSVRDFVEKCDRGGRPRGTNDLEKFLADGGLELLRGINSPPAAGIKPLVRGQVTWRGGGTIPAYTLAALASRFVDLSEDVVYSDDEVVEDEASLDRAIEKFLLN